MQDHKNAVDWLSALDARDYEACWQASAEYFRNGVSLQEWTDKITDARERTGTLQSRTLRQSVETSDIGTGPEGIYLVNEYNSTFTSCGEMGERLTLHQDTDGQMRVIGYYLI